MALSVTNRGLYRVVTSGAVKHLLHVSRFPETIDPTTPVTPGRWKGQDLDGTTWTRRRAVDDPNVYVDWESIVGTAAAAAQAAAPSTPVLLTRDVMLQVTANPAGRRRILSLPPGIFELTPSFEQGTVNGHPGSGYGNGNMLAVGQGASVGYASGCRGITGAGAEFHNGQNAATTTTIRPQSAVPKETSPVAYPTRLVPNKAGNIEPAGNILLINGCTDPYLGGLHFASKQTRNDGVFHGGVVISAGRGTVLVEGISTRGLNPGYSNAPPGETFGINFLNTPNALIRLSRCDGRDLAGNRTCASPIGWNSGGYTNGAYNANTANTTDFTNVDRVYCRYGLTSMLTFWETYNVKTVDYHVYSWASGTGNNRGSGINHEQIGGTVTHIRPTLQLCEAPNAGSIPASDVTSNTGSHMGFGTVVDDPKITIVDPLWDLHYLGQGKSGQLTLQWSYGYKVSTPGISDRIGWDWMRTLPTVTVNGVNLQWALQQTVRDGPKSTTFYQLDRTKFIAGITG